MELTFGKKRLLLLGLCATTLVIFFGGESILAQIRGLYDESNDQVAGVNALMSAVVSNDITGVKFFSKAGKAMVNQKNIGGATALHIACREKNLEMAKVLIENEADVNAVDNEGWTPLMRAALSGDREIVDLLLTRGAEGSNVNSAGESAIIHGSLSDCSDCLNLMFDKFNFMKLMDIQLLKDQLTESFVIARNHDNQTTQKLLDAYLDRVIQMMPLLKEQDLPSEFEDVVGEKKLPLTPIRSKAASGISLIGKKFKLVSDKTSENPAAKKYKFTGQSKPDAPTSNKANLSRTKMKSHAEPVEACSAGITTCFDRPSMTPTSSSKKGDKMVIFLLDKRKTKKTIEPTIAPSVPVSTSAKNTVFKFKQGEPGKILKTNSIQPKSFFKTAVSDKPTKPVESVEGSKTVIIDLPSFP